MKSGLSQTVHDGGSGGEIIIEHALDEDVGDILMIHVT